MGSISEGSLCEKYEVGKTIGQGAFGVVKLAVRKSDREQVVVKQINTVGMSEKERKEAQNEVAILSQFDHANIIKYMDCIIDGTMLCIVMEYAEQGELYTAIRDADDKPFSEDEIMFWFVQICVALQHVHSKKMLHRDLKSQNIFRTKNNLLKLGDFGIAKVLTSESQMAHTAIGTPYYLSPEICEDKPYGPKSDVWALGCILYELCSLKRAFEGQSLPALVMKILRGKYPPIQYEYSAELTGLVSKLLQRKPGMRPTIKEILAMDYVRPHMELYFQRVGGLLGLRPEQLRVPSARGPPRRSGIAGPPGRVRAKGRASRVSRNEEEEALAALAALPPPSAAQAGGAPSPAEGEDPLSASDAAHQRFL
eukprot:CAMPEP_0118943496 /NCGR_PEP_ID=MMETSP1169-20130426/38427_1 /TAXON_ID=36882 /ORGANISM="Pyramimonas obovata, Strain CCMP722" /LENGTH=366 /DNA_ID=CAMNT_0006888763 /DNA_START=214 /DNA_END=1311 /DNA_ORIENTATION=-